MLRHSESALNHSSSGAVPESLIARDLELKKKAETVQKVATFVESNVYKDVSPAAKAGRRRAMMRAAYGEFICTYIFLFTVLGVITNASVNNWNPEIASLASALNAGVQAVAVCFAFSSVSGAHFNPAISFALWLTGKLSNRKVVVYIFVQCFAAVCAMATVLAIFKEDNELIFDACVIKPPHGENNLGRVFATEFFLTFVLTYVAFTIAFEDAEHQKTETMSIKGISQTRGLTIYASTPESKTGFAPFVIGFTIMSLALIGGTSGGAFNQARMFGPALLSGRWDEFYVYMFAEFLGSAVAGLMVHNLHRFGLRASAGNDAEADGESVDPTAVASPLSSDNSTL